MSSKYSIKTIIFEISKIDEFSSYLLTTHAVENQNSSLLIIFSSKIEKIVHFLRGEEFSGPWVDILLPGADENLHFFVRAPLKPVMQ